MAALIAVKKENKSTRVLMAGTFSLLNEGWMQVTPEKKKENRKIKN